MSGALEGYKIPIAPRGDKTAATVLASAWTAGSSPAVTRGKWGADLREAKSPQCPSASFSVFR